MMVESFSTGAPSPVHWSSVPAAFRCSCGMTPFLSHRSQRGGGRQDDGLWAQFRLAMTPVAQVAGQHAADGFMTGMSVGFSPIRSTWKYASEWNPNLGVDHMDHVVRHEALLHEVSLTPTPAYDMARVQSVQPTL